MAGVFYGLAYGGGVFASQDLYSVNNGLDWYFSRATPINYFPIEGSVDGRFVTMRVGTVVLYSDSALVWKNSDYINNTDGRVAASIPDVIPGGGFKNLTAVGNYIYCSTNNVAVQIDTTKDLSTTAAYKFPAPLPTNQYVFANGPRYMYMFAQGDNTAANIVRYDPYPPDTTFKASIIVDYESLPPGVPKPDKALIGVVQTQKVTDMTQMNIKGPVKELWVTGASDTANVFQYSNLAARSMLELTGEHIVTEDVGTRTFLNVIEPFETHTSMPIRNFSVIPFEFDPESDIPNGTINFSRIRDQVFDGNAETVWAHTYNLLAIQGGVGGLMFN
jgi:hypothetical protein